MKTLLGTALETFPYADLEKVEDILYFDGPLISLFKGIDNRQFIYYWTDSDDHCNRWLVFEVTLENLTRYYSNHDNLYTLIKSAVGGFVVAVDIAGNPESFEYLNPTQVAVGDIPEDNLPDRDHSWFNIGGCNAD